MDLFPAQHIVGVDGKRGLFRGLSPRLVSSAISTVVRTKVKQVTKVEDYSPVIMLSFFLILYLMPVLSDINIITPTPHDKCISHRVICVFSSAGGVSIQETRH